MAATFLEGNRVDVNLKEFIKSNTEWLSELLDSDFGLLDDLLRSRVLSMKEINQVKCLSESFARSEKLLNIVLEKDVHEKFIESLRNTKQTHLANFIVAKGEHTSTFGDDWPLTDQEIQTLDTNRGELIDLIDTCDLLSMLHSKFVINKRQMDAIASKSASHEKNDLLLDIMRRKSLNDYRLMTDCLRLTNQSHIAQILNDGEVILALHSHLETPDVDRAEEEIVTKLTNILSNKTLEASDRILERTKLRLIAVKRGHSVVLYVHVKTLEELICIEEGLASGKLTMLITTLFKYLLSRTSIVRLNNVSIDLSEDAFIRAKQLLSVKGQEQLGHQSEAEEQENTTKDRTVVNDLPLEVVDIILQSAVLLHMLNKESRTRTTDFIRRLSSVDQCWFRRITRSRLKKAIWRRLQGLFKKNKRKSTVIRNNEAYLLENIQTEKQSIKPEMAQSMQCVRPELPENIHNKKLIRTLRMTDCLTDVQTMLIKSMKRNIAKNAELLHVIRSFDDKRYNVFVQCLRETIHRFAARVVDMGGVVVKLRLERYRTATKDATKQLLLQKLNDLRDKKKPRSERTEKLLRQLNEDEMEILNSVSDRQTVVWIWCHSQEALRKLQSITEDNALRRFFSNLLQSIPLTKIKETRSVALKMKSDGINESVSVNLDKDQLMKQVVAYELVNSACTSLIRVRGLRAMGVTKLKDKIFVLHRPNVILVFEDRSPFELKEKIEAKELKDPEDIVSIEKENCLYVIGGNGCLWNVTHDHEVKLLSSNLAGGPYTISASGDGHLVMCRNGPPRLEIYGSDGGQILSYLLPVDFRNLRHAVETSAGNFIILHEWLNPTKHIWMWVISELAVINGKLQPTRRFVPKDESVTAYEINVYTYQDLKGPIYLSLDSDDQVFLSEEEIARVTLLDSDLNWMQHFRPPYGKDIPWPGRMCYDREMKQLIIVVNRGAGVNVSTLTNR